MVHLKEFDCRLVAVADPDLHQRGEGRGAFEGLTMNVEFCERNSGGSKNMRYFRIFFFLGGGGKGGMSPVLLPWICH